MKLSSNRGFSLVEMLVVMVVIGVLASLVVAVSGLVQTKAAVERAKGEIAELSAVMETYKADNGEYPRTGKTDDLDPRRDGNPVSGTSREKYEDACEDLYGALAGDTEPKNAPDGKVDENAKVYKEFKLTQLIYKKKDDGKIEEVKGIQDPWGNPYGYSTARAKAEIDYKKDIRTDPNAPRPDKMPGYNATFDLWSTGGSTQTKEKDGEQEAVVKWVKNW